MMAAANDYTHIVLGRTQNMLEVRNSLSQLQFRHPAGKYPSVAAR